MKKNLRSLLCGLLALVLVCSCAGAAFAKDNGATPVISVHGMGGSGLYLNPGTEDAQPVGVFDAKSLLSRGGLIQNVLAAVGGKQTDPNTVIDQIADLMNDYRNIACDEDGNSIYNVGIANYWTDSLKNHPGYLSGTSNEPAICRQVAQNIGADKVYAFNYDWRLDACETAAKLADFVSQVKAKTGKKQVTLIGSSEGTVILSAYIDEYGDRGDIRRLVMINGALTGVSVTKLFCQDLLFDADVVKKYLDRVTTTYHNPDFDFSQLNRLANSLNVGYLCDFLTQVAEDPALVERVYNEIFYPVFGCIPMLWEFIPYDDFDDSVDAMTAIGFLDQSSGLYKKITRYHKVQKRLPGNLKTMQKAGTDVVIVANYGLPNIPINSAYANQTDILIDTKYASVGATTADYGKTLKRTGAHVSPDRIVDAATCLLPNNTWFFKGVAHVNFWYDSQATKFLAGLITNPEKKQSVQTVKAATGNGQFVNTDEKQNIVPFSAGKNTNNSGTKNTNPKNTATAAMKSPATGAHWSLAVGGSGLAASGLLFALYALFAKKKNDAATK